MGWKVRERLRQDVSRRTIVLSAAALFVAICIAVASQVGLDHLLGFWIAFGILIAIIGILWRFKIIL